MNHRDFVNPEYARRVRIGENVNIGMGTVLGALPLIFDRETGRRMRPEMRGGLVIEDNVDIGSGCVLNIGEVRDTIIKEGVMIGHLSSIGHDAVIGRNTGISAHVCVCGFVEIGEWCYVAPQTVIGPYKKIGNYTMIGYGSIVKDDIPEGVIAYNKILETCAPRRVNEWRPLE